MNKYGIFNLSIRTQIYLVALLSIFFLIFIRTESASAAIFNTPCSSGTTASNNPSPIGSGYVYNTHFYKIEYNPYNVGHVLRSNPQCTMNTGQLVYQGAEADQIHVGYHPDGKVASSLSPNTITASSWPEWPLAMPSVYGISNAYHSAFVDDAGAMRIGTDIIWCAGMAGSPANCGTDIYANGWMGSSSNYSSGTGYLYSNVNRPPGSNGCTPLGPPAPPAPQVRMDCTSLWQRWLTDYGTSANGSFTNAVAKSTQGYINNFNFELLGKNTITGGYQVATRVSTRHPQRNASCSVSTNSLSLTAGQSASVNLTFRNTGRATWYSYGNRGNGRYFHRLHRVGTSFSGLADNIQLTSPTVPMNGSQVWAMNFTAPATPGTYSLNYQMDQAGYGVFGQSCPVTVTVSTPSTPSCSVIQPNIGSISIGSTFTTRARITFTGTNVNVTGASYSISGSANVNTPNGNANNSFPFNRSTGTVDVYSNNIIQPTSSGSFTITWNVSSSAGNFSCSRNVSVPAQPPFPPPTCSIVGSTSGAISFPIGSRQSIRVTVTNNSSSSVVSVYGAVFSGVVSGNAVNQSITIPSSGNGEFQAPPSDINSGGSLNLRITYNTATENGRVTDMPCGTVIVTTVVPECNASVNTFNVNDAMYVEISVTNNNSAVLPNVVANYSIPSLGRSGSASPSDGNPNIAAGASKTFTADLPPPPIPPGSYVVNWTVTSAYGACANDAGLVGFLIVRRQPYARFYGGDIVSGGCIATASGSCPSASVDALGFIRGNKADANTITGTGTQLAVFAIGQIDGVQPLANQIVVNPRSLAFANATDPGATIFGGGFGTAACSYDYEKDKAGTNITGNIGLSTTASGSYIVNNGASFVSRIDGSFAGPKDITLYVEGNAYITGTWDGSATVFGYTNTAWTSANDIPSLYVIATGNIYIDYAVDTVNAVLVAQHGEIHTCARSDLGFSKSAVELLDGDQSDADFLIDSGLCGRGNVAVHGAMIAETVHFLRTNNDIGDGTPGEGQSGSQAEKIFFSPEIYLNSNPNINSTPGGQTIDSIKSLPPLF